jgi:hypothetical protein
MAPKEEEEKQEEIYDESTGAALVVDDEVAENCVEKGASDNLDELEMASGSEDGDNDKENDEEKKTSVVSPDSPWSERM